MRRITIKHMAEALWFSLFELPLYPLFAGLYTATFTAGKFILTFPTAFLETVATTLVMTINYITNPKGFIVFTSGQLKADGDVVSKIDYDNFKTDEKKAKNVDGDLFSPYDDDGPGSDKGAAITMRGTNFEEILYGTKTADKFIGLGGNDIFSGLSGKDKANGGDGDDALIMGDGKDKALGGIGNDLISNGRGHDVSIGGGGNDILLFSAGKNAAKGGPGQDIFIFSSEIPAADTAAIWNKQGKTIVRDFDGDEDVLVFDGFFAPDLSGPENPETLADLNPSDVEGVTWKQLKNGDLRIVVGDHVVILKDTAPRDVDLDRLVFTGFTHNQAVTTFVNTGPSSDGEFKLGDTLTHKEVQVDKSGGKTYFDIEGEPLFDVISYDGSYSFVIG